MSLFKTRSSKTNWPFIGSVLGTTTIVVLLSGMIGIRVASGLHTHQATIEVTKAERLQKITEGNSRFVHNVETKTDLYTVHDSILQWHFYSAQTYSNIEVGTCDVLLQGYRIGFLSMKYNILKADCKPKETTNDK